MFRRLAVAAVIVLAPSLAHAAGPIPTFTGCNTGYAIRGINFVTHSIECVPVGGDTAALQAQITALQNALATAQTTIACMHTVGTEVFFDACNVHIRSGAGATDAAVNGLGNLIIGYNEDFAAGARTGSHNLVIGPNHTYSSYGGLVAGNRNFVTGPSATVSGGQNNMASGTFASVSGGALNRASGDVATVGGGGSNTASGVLSSVSGGQENTASAGSASVSGGVGNTANEPAASVSGGVLNTASGEGASVSGGRQVTQGGSQGWSAGSVTGTTVAGDFRSP